MRELANQSLQGVQNSLVRPCKRPTRPSCSVWLIQVLEVAVVGRGRPGLNAEGPEPQNQGFGNRQV